MRTPFDHLLEPLQGVVDLVAMTGITWNGEELGASFNVGDVPDSMKEQARIGLTFACASCPGLFRDRARIKHVCGLRHCAV